MIYADILAGGVGSRMKADLPKQFLSVGGVPIIIRTMRRLHDFALFDRIIVAVHPEWKRYLETQMEAFGLDRRKFELIDGGSERLDTIRNVLSFIAQSRGVEEDDRIVIHDAVRPFLSRRVVEDSLEALDRHEAVVAALAVVDTMLWVEEGNTVSDMPARSRLFHGQAPDSFRLSTLYRAFFALTGEERRIITGTAQICMLKGIPIATVPGDPMNIKITNPFDMKLAEFFCSLEN